MYRRTKRLYLTCTMISSVDLAHYGVSRAKDWVSVTVGQAAKTVFFIQISQGGESRGLNDRVHGISCRYSDKTCKRINYISPNTYSIIMQ